VNDAHADAGAGRVTRRMRARGAVLAGAGCALVAAGVFRVDGVLAAMGLAAWCLLGLAWLLAAANLRRLAVAIDCPAKVHAGANFSLRLTLANPRRWLDAFAVRLELNLCGRVKCGGRAGWVAAGSAADLDLRVMVPVRGSAENHQVALESRFPFGFFASEANCRISRSMVVFPKPLAPKNPELSGIMMDASPREGAAAGDASGDLRGLRNWQPGDATRRIAWPATLRAFARGAGLVVREADPPGFLPRRCLVVFHSFGTDGTLIRPDRFERALSLTAGLLRHLHGLGFPARLIADFDGWTEHPAVTRAQISACLEHLAAAKRARGTEAHDLQAAVARADEDESVFVLSDMPRASWRRHLPVRKLPISTPA
jgi:uncharacterized protein (DUF58 family)